MSVNAVSIAWAFLQIALLCTSSMVVAWSLRGRRPQWVTALLAGTCIASLVLAMIALVPRYQWTLALGERSQISQLPHKSKIPLPANSKQPNPVLQVESEQSITKNQTVPNHIAVSTGQGSLSAIRNLISQYLHRMDREVREVEEWQQPVAKARNFSLLMFASFGLFAMSLLWCSSWFFIRRILICSQSVEDAGMLEYVATQSREFGLLRVPAVRESNLIPIGATVGWRRVTLLLHTDWKEWSFDERKAVVAHELAHAARNDFAWVIIGSWTRILLFFHPMIHVVIRRLRLEQELAADQLAAGKLGSAKVYGRALASLALRSQQSMGTSDPRLCSMLNAGQICVTRRVLNLMHGSLKPVHSRSRWSTCALVAIAVAAIPLAGLRGTTQEPSLTVKSSVEEPQKIESDQNQEAEPKRLSKEFLAAYPPLEFKGSMIYRPGRIRSGEFGPEAAWIHEWFTISTFGKPFPDRAAIYGECGHILKWTDEERQHGRLDFTVGFKEADSTLPGQLKTFADIPDRMNGQRMRTVSKAKVDGRMIAGVTYSDTNDEPEKWMIDDEQGYFLGSLDDAEKYARGQRFALDAIPVAFREDYKNSAFAMVFSDCKPWYGKLESFAKGSPREMEFLTALPLIKDIDYLGVFVDGCRSPACSMRAVMLNESAAKRLATQARTLVEIGKLALTGAESQKNQPEFQAQLSAIETMKVSTSGSEVLFQFDLLVPAFSDASAFTESQTMPGWINLNMDATIVDTEVKAVLVRPNSGLPAMPGLLAQTIDASRYRGKTVSIELEIQCGEELANQSGAFVWASRKEPIHHEATQGRTPLQQSSQYTGHRIIAANSNAVDEAATFSDVLKSPLRFEMPSVADGDTWRKVKVQLTVPSDSEHLSFGGYCKNGSIRIRNLQVMETEFQSATGTQDLVDSNAIADLPFNVLVMPGHKIRKEPTNLNFQQASVEITQQAAKPSTRESR